ncbi:MAG: 30S ribosomal protein S4 [Candidatus Sumerlaeia bacterium]|nr:30S ribosomal protein S4 [Candidatus Sumerlaeia bacterium]
MARYIGPVCRLCRREAKKLYLKGDRCYGPKCAIERRNVPPGQHGQTRTKLSTYGVQLREKQRAKRIYGVLERPFRRYFARADRYVGVTGTVLLQLLERRLDNMVYRIGFASSRRQARQFTRHNMILVNGQRVNIPSYQVRVGDKIALSPSAQQLRIIQENLQMSERRGRKAWIGYNAGEFTATFQQVPSREDLGDIDVREQLIVELYSK